MNALIVGVSFAVGPTVASIVLSLGTWPWLFAVNVPVGVLALVIAWPALPQTPRAAHGFDRVAAALNVITFAALIFALGEAAQRAPAHVVLVALAVALVCGRVAAAARTRPSRADAARRPVQAAGVRAVGGDRRLLVRRAGLGVRVAAVLFRRRARTHARWRPAF